MTLSKYIFRASFVLTCIFLGGVIFVSNLKEIGGKDTKYMALIAPFLVVGLYIVLMLVATENLSYRWKMLMGILTMLATGIGFYSALIA
jgi:hypothetical protein